MADDVPQAAPPSKYLKLTGQPLLYAISIFASLGVFLVRATMSGYARPCSLSRFPSSVFVVWI